MAKSAASEAKAKLVVRHAQAGDVAAVQKLYKKVYPGMSPYSADQLRGQINNFPQGQFVATYEDAVVGYCATFRI
ncbi:MAG: carbon-nitrogen hydrolase, partial [Magnetovibrio sp.]|nr:carbon-nitrogen hydrolase [Magnetovibrio sp.]